jgi:hypothetical protein
MLTDTMHYIGTALESVPLADIKNPIAKKTGLSLSTDFVHNFIVIHLLKIAMKLVSMACARITIKAWLHPGILWNKLQQCKSTAKTRDRFG